MYYLLIAALILSCISTTTGQTNYFINPSSNGGPNSVGTLGEKQVISWKTSLPEYNISFWQQSLVQEIADRQGSEGEYLLYVPCVPARETCTSSPMIEYSTELTQLIRFQQQHNRYPKRRTSPGSSSSTSSTWITQMSSSSGRMPIGLTRLSPRLSISLVRRLQPSNPGRHPARRTMPIPRVTHPHPGLPPPPWLPPPNRQAGSSKQWARSLSESG